MAKEMLINVSEGEECRIALIENGRLDELYMERTSSTSHVGNIYKGAVINVEPSIQAAFIDFGLGRNGFLHISDLMPTYFGRAGDDVKESVGRKMARRDRPPIQKCLRRGDEIVVQIIKEGIGTKGPTLSTYLSIPGRILVMMPGMSKLGVSRKIEDEEERRRLRHILDGLKPPRDSGFILRTAGVGKTKVDIQRDLQYLTRLWQNIEKTRDSGPAPMELYTEGDLVFRTVRDVFTSDVERIVVDNERVANRVREFLKIAMPRTRNKLDLYDKAVPLFHQAGIEKEIEQMYSRHVPLPSGGSLVIDSSEAVVAIDVNSGRFRDHSDAEMTAFKTDMEAADEIPRQLRLRDLGGVIICDFIDLRYERHRRELEDRLHANLRNDRAKTKMLCMSDFGIIEMTRQRMRPSLKRSIYFDCPHCKGAGLVKTPESMALDVMRRLAIAANDPRVQRIGLGVCAEVNFYLQNRKRAALVGLEDATHKRIVIRSEPGLAMDEIKLELFDARDGLVFMEELGVLPPALAVPQGGRPPHRGDGRRDGRRDQRGRDRHRGGQGRPEREDMELDEQLDLDAGEDAVEEREHEMEEQADAEVLGATSETIEEEGDELPFVPAPAARPAPAIPPAAQRPAQGQRPPQRPPLPQRPPQQRPAPQPSGQRPPAPVPAGQRPVVQPSGAPRPVIQPVGAQRPVGQQPQQPPMGGGDEEQGGRKRRRRRGRRGRGRGRSGQGQPLAPVLGGQEFPRDDAQPVGELSLAERLHQGPAGAAEQRRDEGRDENRGQRPMPGEARRETRDMRAPAPAPAPANQGQVTPPAPEPRVAPAARVPQPPQAELPTHVAPPPAPVRAPEPPVEAKRPQAAPAAEAPAAEPKPKRRRAASPKAAAGKSAATPRRRAATTRRKPAKSGAEPSEPAPAPVLKPPADRHLADDEPVFQTPVSRPRSARDLDSIPDDLE